MEWKLADAKNKLSEVVTRALEDGPQIIKRRQDDVVILSRTHYEQLIGETVSLKAFLLEPNPSLEGLDLSRDQSDMRDVEL